MKRYLALLIIRNANQNFVPLRMTVTKKATNNKCWRGCGERGTLSPDGGNVNCGHMENSMEFPQKANTRTTV